MQIIIKSLGTIAGLKRKYSEMVKAAVAAAAAATKVPGSSFRRNSGLIA